MLDAEVSGLIDINIAFRLLPETVLAVSVAEMNLCGGRFAACCESPPILT